ncbi:MAG: hypothetical protein AAGA90_07400 [Actinomycetota bacterium]
MARSDGSLAGADGSTTATAGTLVDPSRRPSLTNRLLPTDQPSRIVLAAFVAGLPATLLGYGTDIDIANVLRAGESFFDGDYELSRPPGNLPYEVTAHVLDLGLGPGGVVLGSLVTAALALLALASLMRSESIDPTATVALVVASPWWWLASTSLGDYLMALALVLAGARARTRDSIWIAGLCFGLAIGVRASTVGLVAAWLLADLWGRRRDEVSPLIATGVVTVLVGAACFVPVWLASGRSLDFVTTETQVTNLTTLIGRWGVKNLAFWGPVAAGVLLWWLALRARVDLRWTSSRLVRFAALGFVWTELVYLRFPWKPLHLLPAVVFAAILFARAPRRAQWGLGFALALNAVITLTVATPDVPHRATSGELDLEVRPGVVLTDIGCRLDDRDLGDWPATGTTEAYDRAVGVFDCQAQLWRSD